MEYIELVEAQMKYADEILNFGLEIRWYVGRK